MKSFSCLTCKDGFFSLDERRQPSLHRTSPTKSGTHQKRFIALAPQHVNHHLRRAAFQACNGTCSTLASPMTQRYPPMSICVSQATMLVDEAGSAFMFT